MKPSALSFSTCLALTCFGLAAIAPVAQASSVDEAAPVLGRILGKRLGEQGVQMTNLQWVHLEGRGLLLLGGVNLLHLKPHDAKTKNAEDLVWENARRESLGQAPIRANADSRTRSAILAVQEALGKFASRVPVPAGEDVRVALYSDTSSCQSCHGAPAKKASPKTSSKEPQETIRFLLDDSAARIRSLPYVNPLQNVHDKMRRDVVVLSQRGIESSAGSYLAADPGTLPNGDGGEADTRRSTHRDDDSAVLARVLGKRIRQAFPDEFWGVDVKRRPGAIGFSAGDWGSIVVLNMTFPLTRNVTPSAQGKDDLWEQTLREVRGEIRADKQVVDSASKSGIDADAFVRAVKSSLIDFGGRVRDLGKEQEIAVLVFSGAHRHSMRLPAVGSIHGGTETEKEEIRKRLEQYIKAGVVSSANDSIISHLTSPVAQDAKFIVRARGDVFLRQKAGAPREELFERIAVD